MIDKSVRGLVCAHVNDAGLTVHIEECHTHAVSDPQPPVAVTNVHFFAAIAAQGLSQGIDDFSPILRRELLDLLFGLRGDKRKAEARLFHHDGHMSLLSDYRWILGNG